MAAFLAKAGPWLHVAISIAALVLGGFNTLKPKPTPAPTPPPPKPTDPYVTLPANKTVVAGELFVILADTNCKTLNWDGDAGIKFVDQEYLNPAKPIQLGLAAVPGQYAIRVHSAAADVPIKSNECIVTVTGPQPPPGPQPQPDPKPDPKPIPPAPPAVVKESKLTIYTIDDATQRTPEITKLLSDPYWQFVRQKGHTVKQVNSTNAEYLKTFAAQWKMTGGKPTIIVIGNDSQKWLNAEQQWLFLPADAPSIKALLLRYTDNL